MQSDREENQGFGDLNEITEDLPQFAPYALSIQAQDLFQNVTQSSELKQESNADLISVDFESYSNPDPNFSIVSASNTANSQLRNFTEPVSPSKSISKSYSRSRRSNSRPVKEISGTGLFSQFAKFGSNSQRPKKEYVRMTTVRAMIRAWTVFPKLRASRYTRKHPFEDFKNWGWHILSLFFEDRENELLGNIFRPRIDAKTEAEKAACLFNTYNDKFMDAFFSVPILHEFGSIFLNMIFWDLESHDYERLKRFYKMSCCSSPHGHNEMWYLKWLKLKQFLFESLLNSFNFRHSGPPNPSAQADYNYHSVNSGIIYESRPTENLMTVAEDLTELEREADSFLN